MTEHFHQFSNEEQRHEVTDTNYGTVALRYYSDYPFGKEMCRETRAREHFVFPPIPSMAAYMEAREWAIDAIAVERGIKRGVRNYIEFAGGFHTRALWMTVRYPEISFVDTDQTGLVHLHKREHIRAILGYEPGNLHYEVLDVVEGTGREEVRAHLLPDSLAVGMIAGLLRYLTHEQKAQVARQTSALLGKGGICITCDTFTKADLHDPAATLDPRIVQELTVAKRGVDYYATMLDNVNHFREIFQGNGYRSIEFVDTGTLVPDISCLHNDELFKNESEGEKERARDFYRRRKLAVMTV
ncbi:MAG: class I SAM-dependent methyltransferase [Candidatus Eremiobacteraeota bacterium]|nr:class I SAM-dependent methyltransferase [Candidatus Eremiobacteraeota bacterium]